MVETKLEKLVSESTREPAEHSDWATPIVAVLKPDKRRVRQQTVNPVAKLDKYPIPRQRVRICGDFKQTVNPVAKLDKYPIPRVEDLFAKLAWEKVFTKLDLSQAYLQLPLDEELKVLVVVNTQKGLFCYTRLPYGVSSAPRGTWRIYYRESPMLLCISMIY